MLERGLADDAEPDRRDRDSELAGREISVEMVDRNVREGRGAKTAFADPARRITYAELAEDVARVGSMLARLGLQPEDRFAMFMQDTVDFPVLFWGAIRAGINIIHINTELRLAWRQGLLNGLAHGETEIVPYKVLRDAVDSVQKVVSARLRLFNGLTET